MRREAEIGPLIALSLVIVTVASLLALSTATADVFVGSAETQVAMGVDADPSGNSANSLGDIDDCREVNLDDTFDVDVIIQNVGNIAIFGVTFSYDGTILNVIGHDSDTQMLAANEGSNVQFDLSDATPDDDGFYLVGAVDTATPGSGAHESGDGVLARLTLQAVGPGTSAITIVNPNNFSDENGDAIPPVDEFANFTGTVFTAYISVDETCAPLPSPTATPTTDGDGATDTDGDGTPDEDDAFPLDASEDTDTDGDGIGNNADLDDDGDGESDADEIAGGSDPLDDTSLSPNGGPDTGAGAQASDGGDDGGLAWPIIGAALGAAAVAAVVVGWAYRRAQGRRTR